MNNKLKCRVVESYTAGMETASVARYMKLTVEQVRDILYRIASGETSYKPRSGRLWDRQPWRRRDDWIILTGRKHGLSPKQVAAIAHRSPKLIKQRYHVLKTKPPKVLTKQPPEPAWIKKYKKQPAQKPR